MAIGFDPNYIVTRQVELGFRGYATGALPATWNIVSGVNVTDVAVKTDTVNICWAPQTRTTGPQIIYNATSISNEANWRMYGSVRVVAVNQNTFIGFSTVVNAIPLATQLIYVGVRIVAPNMLRINNLGTTADMSGTLTANRWYHVGIEKIGTRLRFFLDAATNSTNITALNTYMNLQLVYETTCPAVPTTVYAWAAFTATATAPTTYSGVGDWFFDELAPHPPADINFAGFAPGLMPVAGSYSTYKNLRKATEMLNNLVLSP